MDKERSERYLALLDKVSNALADDQLRVSLRKATEHSVEVSRRAFEEVGDVSLLLEKARRVKESAIENLEGNLEMFKQKVEMRGGTVFIARTAEEANSYISELAKRKGVKTAVKSKSLTSEEIEVNKLLEKEGVTVVETDLGERIIQLAHQRPSHLTAPAIHLNRTQVAKIFSRELGIEVPPDIPAINRVARESLRPFFLKAEMGLSGANIAVAETGSIIVVTNEGNGRLVTSIPKIHVVVMGMEKIVSTLEDALTILSVLPRSATGQRITTYVSVITGPTAISRPDASRKELHVVILDNGRRKARSDGLFKEALYCIRCAACMNVCPTYRVVGGHTFGHIYPGPIGIPWTHIVHSQERAMDIAPLCISCGLCKDTCPEDIDIPLMISRIKQQDIETHGAIKVNKYMGDSDSLARIASYTSPFSNWLLRRSFTRLIMDKTLGVDRRRPMPPFRRSTFKKWFEKHRSTGSRKVAYFVDTYANYCEPEIGIASVDILEKNGVEVVFPEQKWSGMPLLLYGYVEEAKNIAEFNVTSLGRLVEEGYEVVASEPTAAYCFKEVYPRLLNTEEAKRVAAHTHELFGYLHQLQDRGELKARLTALPKETVGYHMPCHSRSLNPQRSVVGFMEMIGLDIRFIDHGCCGMAGTFGIKRGLMGYELSMEVGKPLFEDLGKPEISFVTTESSVCKMHIEHGTGKKVIHPVMLLQQAYRQAD